MPGGRRPIPEPVQRAVRQRCAFGCIFCGLPIYQVDHIYGYDPTVEDTADRLTLLCPTHHTEKTNGLRTVGQVLAADGNPYNREQGVSSPYSLHFEGDSAELLIGSNRFANSNLARMRTLVAILIDDMPIVRFTFDENRLNLYVDLFDEENELILQIEANELVYATDLWDIKFERRKLTLNQAGRQIIVTIEFVPPNRILIERGRILYNGIELEVWPEYLMIVNNLAVFAGGQALDNPVALGIGALPPVPAGAIITGVPRYIDWPEARASARRRRTQLTARS